MSKQESSGEVPVNVNVSGQGIQVGAGSTQYNSWVARQPLDLAALNALNPHTAATRLQQLQHDELVDFFARAPADDVAELLATLLEFDEPRVVAALADMNHRRSTELINPLDSTANWLASLPEAVEALTRKAISLKWARADSVGMLERFGDGYVRKYKEGRIFWHDEYGTHAISGAIEEFWANHSDWLEFPIGDSGTPRKSPSGTAGIIQPFEGVTVFSSKHGVYGVDQIIMQCYENDGGAMERLGFPIGSDEEESSWKGAQPFEGGVIYWNHTGTYTVTWPVAHALPEEPHFFPVSKEAAVASPFGTSARVQLFRASPEAGAEEMAIFSLEGNSVIVVPPQIWAGYRNLGGADSWLGLPSAEVDLSPGELDLRAEERSVSQSGEAPPAELSDQVTQDFEGGTIFWQLNIGTFAVPAATVESLLRYSNSEYILGWPVSENLPIGTGGSDYIQFFEQGNVTVRHGKCEVSLRLDAE